MGLLDGLKDNLGFGDDDNKKDQPAPTPSANAAEGPQVDAPPAPWDQAADQVDAPPAPWDPQAGQQDTTPEPVPAPAPAGKAAAAPAKPADKPAKPAAKEAHKARTYTVKKGDTLSEIGERFGVNWREIAKVNHVKNPDLIYPGQVFTIPE